MQKTACSMGSYGHQGPRLVGACVFIVSENGSHDLLVCVKSLQHFQRWTWRIKLQTLPPHPPISMLKCGLACEGGRRQQRNQFRIIENQILVNIEIGGAGGGQAEDDDENADDSNDDDDQNNDDDDDDEPCAAFGNLLREKAASHAKPSANLALK